ncbi:hypothetical protein [Sporomusa aerivorans]|uniref:hypothetical protein n=1 Tax=Sporomusa aerivorans TaxID=204936 RepID=UPI00352AEE06
MLKESHTFFQFKITACCASMLSGHAIAAFIFKKTRLVYRAAGKAATAADLTNPGGG